MPLMSDGFGPFSAPTRAPWQTPHGLSAVLEGWQADSKVWRNVVLNERLPAEAAVTVPLPPSLAPALQRALVGRGIDRIYSHQQEAFALSALGSDVVVSTPTASGKSLCYNLPVLHALAHEAQGRAIYLFPTKALARDQEVSLRALLNDAGLEHGAITYDGDTPGDARRAARDRSGILWTNPDMLHTGILPHHASWARMFANLRYVVVDELHTYRGVFGSHLANVLRRLLRVARFHGAEPRFVFASATIGNPEQHASRMLGRKVVLVGRSGAPKSPRRVMVYNPPVVNAELGIRASYLKTAVRLTSDLISAGVSTLVFGQSRNNIEVMLKYLRDGVQKQKRDPRMVQSYRGGYLPEERRAIERALRDGEIRCVVATNALELGIDIGSLDAVVCAGYPGTIAGLFQRFGRSGRRGAESLSLLVTSSAPLDQYLARAPEALLSAESEEARIDPDNVEILVQHVKCAAFELPFEQGERFGDVPEEVVSDALEFLAEHRLVHRSAPAADGGGDKPRAVYHWSSDAYPANHVSLRSIGWDNFVVIDLERDVVIAEMDYRATHTMLHVQAIYQHGGEQFQVERLDFENHKAFVRKVDSDYFTDAMTNVRVGVLERDQSAVLVESVAHPLAVSVGEVSVIEKVVGYKKIKFHSHENVGYGEVNLPEMQMHTSALWLTVAEAVVIAQRWSRAEVIDALRGLGHALHTVASISLMVDPRDLGHTLGDHKEGDAAPSKGGRGAPGFDPTVFVYDRMPGGVGLAPRLFEQRDELLARTLRLIRGCECASGCPSCVGPQAGIVAQTGTLPSRREIAIELLRDLGITLPH
ncbi:MAG TPA: DEAD/DEAH box helicase [Polyangiales bacterium]|nr:DEAD/DEAH box helicase [Polyangiales bacterium]